MPLRCEGPSLFKLPQIRLSDLRVLSIQQPPNTSTWGPRPRGSFYTVADCEEGSARDGPHRPPIAPPSPHHLPVAPHVTHSIRFRILLTQAAVVSFSGNDIGELPGMKQWDNEDDLSSQQPFPPHSGGSGKGLFHVPGQATATLGTQHIGVHRESRLVTVLSENVARVALQPQCAAPNVPCK